MSLNNVKFSRKIALCFAGVVSIVAIMSAVLYVEVKVCETSSYASDRLSDGQSAATDALAALVEQQNAVRGFVANGDEAFVKTVQVRGEDFTNAIARLDKAMPEVRAQSDELKAAAAQAQSDENEQIAMRRNPAQVAEAQRTINSKGRLTHYREVNKGITERINADVAKTVKAEHDAFNTTWLALLVGGISVVGLSILLGWMLTRALARPIVAMTGTMNKLASGDNSVEVLGLERRDEVGEMARAVQTFKDAAIEKIRLERDAESQRGLTETERAERAREQATVVTSIATGLEKLAAGDLVFRVTAQFAPEYEKLRVDFNAAMEKLQETMKIVASNAAGIRSGTDEITQASDDLSRRTEQQAANLEETAAALDEITATVRKTADGANQAREVVSSAKADAEHSGQVVRDAVAAMSEIEKSAQQISQIIGVIDEIAFQTNLLALNAGVEAARAGEAGKGFAVVASEVRALAQRSAEAAKEIKTLISASSQQVEVGVELVGETGKALERIVGQVGGINGVVAEIASSAQEQATGLQQVNTAVNQMDQVTQQNAAMVEQSTAASHALAQETEELARLIGRFRIGDETPARTAVIETIPPRSARRGPLPVAAPAGARGATAALARRLEPVASEDTWEEF
jgi:methyl-accepting chemotaxis protein